MPYRALYVLDPEPPRTRDDGTRIAFAVMTLVGAVPLVVPCVSAAQTAFGGLCAVTGAVFLVRERRRAISASRVRPSPAPSACQG